MKKRLLITLIMLLVLGFTGNAFAATLTDLPAKHWAYDAVSKLVKAGLVEGYSDNTFRGDKPISRYEMAIVVSKAMDNYSKADEANKTEMLKLVTEFSKELNNMGIRLTNLEKNQPNLKFEGKFDVRYTAQENKGSNIGTGDSKAQYRLRLEGSAKIDDKSSFNMRFASNGPDVNNFQGSSWTTSGQTGKDYNGSAKIDRAYFTTKMGSVEASIGRQPLVLDPNKLLVDYGNYSYEGIALGVPLDKNFKMAINYGRFASDVTYKKAPGYYNNLKNLDVSGIALIYKSGNFSTNLGYSELKNFDLNTSQKKYYTASVSYLINPQLSFDAEYVKNTVDSQYAASVDNGKTATWFQFTYGDQKINDTGKKNFVLAYYNAGGNSLINSITTLDSPDKPYPTDAWKGIDFGVNYGFSKNYSIEAHYAKITDKSNDVNSYNYSRIVLHTKF